MTEVEKLDAGLAYDFWDEGVNERKIRAIELCAKLESVSVREEETRAKILRELFRAVGEEPSVGPGFLCDWGKNISVGKQFLANYNVTILDIMPVTIGDYVMIGPGTMISTVNHPLSPAERRKHMGIGRPVRIGNDVWIGGNVSILPGVNIGTNVVVAAGAVVTHDIPDNCIAAGVPAKVIREINNDIGHE